MGGKTVKAQTIDLIPIENVLTRGEGGYAK